jgi:hypothetical protein
LDVIHFSGKTLHAVQQDFYANVFLISLTSILKAQIPVKLKTKQFASYTGLHILPFRPGAFLLPNFPTAYRTQEIL